MKKLVFVLPILLFCCFHVNSQDYLQIANDCFEKGDYESEKRNYTIFQNFGGRDMTAQIKKADECLRALIVADDYFKTEEYAKAKERYQFLSEKNPKDLHANKQVDLCEEQLKPTKKNQVKGPEMILVRGGTFAMGCTSEQGSDCIENEKPAHQVSVSDFYIGKYEVTQAQWKAVMGNDSANFQKGDNYPVEWVRWDDIVGANGASMVINGIRYYADGFIYKLNQSTGKQYRLPTEAEWEFAARGGNNSKGSKYSGSNTVENVAWYKENSSSSTHPVGTKLPNELGIYNMSGNVWEWCSDWFGDYNNNTQTNPIGPSSGFLRVARGGSWGSSVGEVRVSFRSYWYPVSRAFTLGFRLARSPN